MSFAKTNEKKKRTGAAHEKCDGLHIPLLFILPMVMKNKVFAVVLSAPISDVMSVIVTLFVFVPGFYHKMHGLTRSET